MRETNRVLVCITGQTGSGKSELCKLMRQKGFPVLISDEYARKAVEKGTQCLEQLKEAFGQEILDPVGGLNRAKLASIAFADPDKTTLLNSITHPFITALIKKDLDSLYDTGNRAVIIEIPLLAESGMLPMCDLVVVITADESIRKSRITARDNIAGTAADTRMKAHKLPDYPGAIHFENNAGYPNLQRFADELENKINTMIGKL